MTTSQGDKKNGKRLKTVRISASCADANRGSCMSVSTGEEKRRDNDHLRNF